MSCASRLRAPLVIEDVHWADETTVNTLRFLVRRIAQLPVILLLTYRDDELSATTR
jgi:predicted ATPase